MESGGRVALLTFFAVLAALIPVAFGFLIARFAARRTRDDDRHRSRRLAAAMRAHLKGALSAQVLQRLVKRADEATFWDALETHLVRLNAKSRRRLGATLVRSHHLAVERRVLLADSPRRRELAARRLGMLPTSASRRALRGAMGASRGIVAHTSARMLAGMGDLTTLEWLLENPGHLRGRTGREWADLFQAFGPRALPRLHLALELGVPDPAILRGVIEAVGHGGHTISAPPLERLLRHTEQNVRVAAARALGRLGEGSSAPALLRALDDEAWPVRAQAAWALGRLGRDTAADALANRLVDRAWWVRRHAAYALSRLGERGTNALTTAIASSDDRYAREIAEEALASLRRSA